MFRKTAQLSIRHWRDRLHHPRI